MKPLAIIPTYVSSPEAMRLTQRCISTLRASSYHEVDILVVDDRSPVPYAEQIKNWAVHYGCDHVIRRKNGGFSKTVNVGLAQATVEGRDAVLINADIEFNEPFWFQGFKDYREEYAVQGALLKFPHKPYLVQHAGIYFSVLRREFDHISRFAMPDLPDLNEFRRCPVTAALMYIRHDTLEKVGLFDEGFRMGWEDVDYCLRVFAAGEECWYNPNVEALHYEEAFRGGKNTARMRDWINTSHRRLWEKHAGTDFSKWVPTMIGV